jgi:hypothetical protein
MLISFFGPSGAAEADVVGALVALPAGDDDGLSDAPLELQAANISIISDRLAARVDFRTRFEILIPSSP